MATTDNYFGSDLEEGMVLDIMGARFEILETSPHYELHSAEGHNPDTKILSPDFTRTVLTVKANTDLNPVPIIVDNDEEYPVFKS